MDISYWTLDIYRPFRWLGQAGTAVAVFTFLTYALLFQRRVLLDITAQVQTLEKWLHGDVALPPTALFYLLTWVCAGFQRHFVLLMGGALVALTLLAVAKWHATRWLLAELIEGLSLPQPLNNLNSSTISTNSTTPLTSHLSLLAFLLALVCSLPTPDWWLRGWYVIGQPSPNYWMNGTLLASWPLALVLFGQSWQQLRDGPQARWALWMLLWLAALVVSKPSYALVFAVVYPLFLVGTWGLRRRAVWWQLLPLLGLAALLAAEYWLVFKQSDSVYVREFNLGRASGVAWGPLVVWRQYSSNLLVSVLAGVAFPLAVAAGWWRQLRRERWFWYVWATFAAALALSAAFVQEGEEWYTWAFRFQNYIAAHLLFVASLAFCWVQFGYKISAPAPPLRTKLAQLTGKERIVTLLFVLHLLSGLVYLAKMWWTKSHY